MVKNGKDTTESSCKKNRRTGGPRILALKKNVSYLSVAVGIIFVWRGMWNMMDSYLLPGHPLMSNVLSIALGILILYLPDSDIKELS